MDNRRAGDGGGSPLRSEAVNSRVFPAWTPWVSDTAPSGLVSTYALYETHPRPAIRFSSTPMDPTDSHNAVEPSRMLLYTNEIDECDVLIL